MFGKIRQVKIYKNDTKFNSNSIIEITKNLILVDEKNIVIGEKENIELAKSCGLKFPDAFTKGMQRHVANIKTYANPKVEGEYFICYTIHTHASKEYTPVWTVFKSNNKSDDFNRYDCYKSGYYYKVSQEQAVAHNKLIDSFVEARTIAEQMKAENNMEDTIPTIKYGFKEHQDINHPINNKYTPKGNQINILENKIQKNVLPSDMVLSTEEKLIMEQTEPKFQTIDNKVNNYTWLYDGISKHFKTKGSSIPVHYKKELDDTMAAIRGVLKIVDQVKR